MMNSETRRVLKAVRDNGLEVELRHGIGGVHVQVVDPRRNAETSFTFDEASEGDVRRAIARAFCSGRQQGEFLGGAGFELGEPGPYRFAVV